MVTIPSTTPANEPAPHQLLEMKLSNACRKTKLLGDLRDGKLAPGIKEKAQYLQSIVIQPAGCWLWAVNLCHQMSVLSLKARYVRAKGHYLLRQQRQLFFQQVNDVLVHVRRVGESNDVFGGAGGTHRGIVHDSIYWPRLVDHWPTGGSGVVSLTLDGLRMQGEGGEPAAGGWANTWPAKYTATVRKQSLVFMVSLSRFSLEAHRQKILVISRVNVPNHSPFTPEWKLAIHAGLLGGCLHAGRWLKQRASQRLVEALPDTLIVQQANISKKNSKSFCFEV